jgi:hypothetical protein
MTVYKFSNVSGFKNYQKYNDFLAGNPAVILDKGSMYPLGVFTLSSSASSVEFTNIPQTYKHLEIRSIAKDTAQASGSFNLRARFNNDSAGNYTLHRLFGQGTSASADAYTGQTSVVAGNVPANGYTNVFGAGVCQILDYTSTSKNKTVRTLSGADVNGSGGYIFFTSNLWLNTAAITSITLLTDATALAANSSFALYGIL